MIKPTPTTLDLSKKLKKIGPTSQQFVFKRETKEKIEQKHESLYSSVPTWEKRIKNSI